MREAFNLSPYAVTDPVVADEMLNMLALGDKEIFCDIGAGTGGIVLQAALRYPDMNVIAIESDERRAHFLKNTVKGLGVARKVDVIYGDVFDVDLQDVTAATVYLTFFGNRRLRPKLENELKESARVVSHEFLFDGWMFSQIKSVYVPHVYYFPRRDLILYKMSDIHKF